MKTNKTHRVCDNRKDTNSLTSLISSLINQYISLSHVLPKKSKSLETVLGIFSWIKAQLVSIPVSGIQNSSHSPLKPTIKDSEILLRTLVINGEALGAR
jgi:hypothetical protein